MYEIMGMFSEMTLHKVYTRMVDCYLFGKSPELLENKDKGMFSGGHIIY